MGGKVVRVCRDGSRDEWTGHGEWEEEADVNRETASGYIGTCGTGGNVCRVCRDGSRDEWTGHSDGRRAVEYIGTGGTGGNVGRVCREGSRDEWTSHGNGREDAGVYRERAVG